MTVDDIDVLIIVNDKICEVNDVDIKGELLKLLEKNTVNRTIKTCL